MEEVVDLFDDDFIEYINYVEENPYQNIPRRYIRDAENPLEFYLEHEFIRRYRFSKNTVIQTIVPMVAANILENNTNRGLPIPVLLKVLITLRFYATSSFQTVCGDLRSIHQSTVSRIIKTVSYTLAQQLRYYVHFPQREAEAAKNRNQFFAIAEFPGVSGCIDCTHIPIRSPGGQFAELYRNRKGWMSLNIQVVGGPRLEILDIVIRWPGSTHDARIFDNSGVKVKFEERRVSGVLLGDNGYPQLQYLFTPLLHPIGPAELRYNRSHKTTRNTLERLFGVWKRRFPCLSRKLLCKTATTTRIIGACAVLHNIAIRQGDPLPEGAPQQEQDMVPVANLNLQQGRGDIIRAAFIEQHFA